MRTKKQKTKNKYSAKTYKITSLIAYIVSVLFIIIGIPTFAIGGFFLVIAGVFIFFLGCGYKKEYLSILSEENNNTTVRENSSIKTQPIQSNTLNKIETHKVTGVSFREKEILSIIPENDAYDYSRKELIDLGYWNERIYKYEFNTNQVKLLPEPTNPHDPKAIKVMINDIHIGYIKSGSCSHIHNLLNEDKILKIDCEIKGGKYKYLSYNDIDDSYQLNESDSPIFVRLKIYIK